jgi:hypothetical protein
VIFNLYGRLKVKLGDEEHVFDRSRLMFTEVAEIEKVTGLSYGEWERELGRYSIAAVGALLHVLRKRDGTPSDYAAMQFNAADLDVIPLHDDGSEFTAEEVAKDLAKRMEEATEGAGPTRAAAGLAVAPEESPPISPSSTSPSSLNGSGSGPGNGTGSPTRTSPRARRTSTPS